MKIACLLGISLFFALRLLAQPVINSFIPATGPIGTTVTIKGTGFNTIPANNVVYFGAVKASVHDGTDTTLVVAVPAGTTYHPITVTTNNLTAYSAQPFIVTFPSDNPAITVNSFSAVANYGIGTYPFAIAISDFNDDGKPDLVTANSVGNNISILKNNSTTGTITFSPKVDFTTGPDPKRIVIGDLDGDGKPDIVVTNCNAGLASTISIFRNTSTGGVISFAPRADYATGNGSIGVAITDLNADGKPDIVVTSGNSGIFSIFKNTTSSSGSITLAPKVDYTLLTHPDNVTIADLDKDGKPDIITANSSAYTISVFRNTYAGGDISLAPRIDYPTGTHPSFVTTGDLDGDGKLEVAVTNYVDASISFFRNNSSSGNISLVRQDHAFAPTNFSIADLNGDGKLDLFAGRGLTGKVSVLENNSSGPGILSFAPNIDFTTGTYDTYVAAGDLDGDGKPELAAANTIQNTVTILKNTISDPEIALLSTTTGVAGTAVTITGNRLTGATSVKFGGVPAASFNVISSTRVDAVVGAGASGDVTVTTPLGTAAKSGFNFIPVITAEGATTFCNGSSVLLVSSAAANNQWYKDNSAINGATAGSLQVTSSGNYIVKTTSNGITTTSNNTITVTAITISAPVITLNANNLVSSAATGNQWYLNGNIIAGATSQTYQPAQSGNYTVNSTQSGCTSDFSASYNFIITGIINLNNGQYIRLYPNPVRNELNINWNINGMPLLNIEISDILGRKLLFNENMHNGTAINLSGLPHGFYFVRIYSNQLKINETVKIIREN